MDGERYVGERRALRHFLQELRPLVVAALGEDALLRYRIDRGLQTGDLGTLRQAREMFHHQPEDLKRRLMRGIFEAPTPKPSKSHLLEPAPSASRSRSSASTPIRRRPRRRSGCRSSFDHGSATTSRSGSWSAPARCRRAAGALRQIAAWIERDRRLLSARHWQEVARAQDPAAADRQPAAIEDAPGDSADQA